MKSIRTLRQLNAHNKRSGRRDAQQISKCLKNVETSRRTCELIKHAAVSGAFFDSNDPQSITSLVEKAHQSLGNGRRRFANRGNASRSRQKVHAIGPFVTPPPDCPVAPYRLPRTLNGYIGEFIRQSPTEPRLISFKKLREHLTTIAQSGVAYEPVRDLSIKSHPLRDDLYRFTIEGTEYKFSFSQFENLY